MDKAEQTRVEALRKQAAAERDRPKQVSGTIKRTWIAGFLDSGKSYEYNVEDKWPGGKQTAAAARNALRAIIAQDKLDELVYVTLTEHGCTFVLMVDADNTGSDS